jgi:peroxiredoxin
LRALQDGLERHQARLEELGATLLAISPQTQAHSLSTVEKNSLTFDVLCDSGNDVARSYGLVYALDAEARDLHTQFGAVLPDFNGDDSWELPHPATFVIGTNGIIAWSFVNADYTKRAEPVDVVKVLQHL